PARPQSTVEPTRQQAPQGLPIRGNRNSSIYHLPGCPSFDAMAKHNIIEFRTEAEAQAAGFRRAGNCK
ncbi:Ada metal-binding domain-containing protein, partial [Arthrospira platensis SPKY2]